MPDAILDDISHRRYNPLRGSWVLVSPHRTKRPWQGQQEGPSQTTLPEYDPSCYLCPTNTRAQGDVNPDYERTFVFVNDYSAVRETQAAYTPANDDGTSATLANRPKAPPTKAPLATPRRQHADGSATDSSPASQLLQAAPVTGKCYVLAFSRAHNLTLADLAPAQILPIVQMWTAMYAAHLAPAWPRRAASRAAQAAEAESAASLPPELRPRTQYRYMQIFENKGAAMGCSNPHPHGQIWTTAGPALPEEPEREMQQLAAHLAAHGTHMLVEYAALEMQRGERVIAANSHFVAVCPWWAVWPFEVLVLPFAHKRALVDLNVEEQGALAEALAEVTRRYDNLFATQFPYSMGVHQAPLDGSAEEITASSLHVHFYPPLLRSATVRKFLVGYELLAEPQRDITPEQAAARLRNCGGELYRERPTGSVVTD